MKLGLLLFLPGLAAFVYSLLAGPVAWSTDSQTYWGLPVSLFVFWIGLAHAGTLLSAVFLALGVRLPAKVAMLAELSTLCCLAIAAVFPLMHLGVVENFYMVAPFADARENFANVRSPLVWDFVCIAVYGLLSTLFFVTHLKAIPAAPQPELAMQAESTELAAPRPALEKLRKPMAWLLFPLVLWVHTVVSLDFATTFVPHWQGAFFPIYFIAGAIYSGLALVNLLLCAEGVRLRMLERLMLAGSWILAVVWLWDFLLKGVCCLPAVLLAGAVPQLLLARGVCEKRLGRAAVCSCILLGLLAERLWMVMPADIADVGVGVADIGLVDYGLIVFSAGTFVLLFGGLCRRLGAAFEGRVENCDNENGTCDCECSSKEGKGCINEVKDCAGGAAIVRTLLFPLALGVLIVAVFMAWALNQNVFENVPINFLNVFPLTFPLVALVATVVLYTNFFVQNKFDFWGRRRTKNVLKIFVIVMAAVMGLLYGGGSSVPANEEQLNVEQQSVGRNQKNNAWILPQEVDKNCSGNKLPTIQHRSAQENVWLRRDGESPAQENVWPSQDVSVRRAALIWNARCIACHGTDGRFNEKFVREYYPMPQKLATARLDSLGVDSLVQVILKGRVNMNAYEGRLTESEARALVEYMRLLAGEAK